jgi:toxin YoeB
MKLLWSNRGWLDYVWAQENEIKLPPRVNELIRDTLRGPVDGIGKPEPLRNEMAGQWSRRVAKEHRLFYRVAGKGDEHLLEILSCRFHCDKQRLLPPPGKRAELVPDHPPHILRPPVKVELAGGLSCGAVGRGAQADGEGGHGLLLYPQP